MRLLISLFVSFFLASAANAATLLNDKGRPDAGLVAQFVASAKPMIGEYPPRFASKEQEAQVRANTRLAVDEMQAADLSAVRNQDLMTDIALIFSMAHNLDLGTGGKAKTIFEKALALNPESRRTNYQFGMYLVSTRAWHFDAVPYLQKALALGEQEAMYTLGLLMVHAGDKAGGLDVLQTYAKTSPHPENALRTIEMVKAGKLSFGTK